MLPWQPEFENPLSPKTSCILSPYLMMLYRIFDDNWPNCNQRIYFFENVNGRRTIAILANTSHEPWLRRANTDFFGNFGKGP